MAVQLKLLSICTSITGEFKILDWVKDINSNGIGSEFELLDRGFDVDLVVTIRIDGHKNQTN